jgi:hypothetical protein
VVDAEKIADALLRYIEEFRGSGNFSHRRAIEAQTLYRNFERNYVWHQMDWCDRKAKKAAIKKAIDTLKKRGKIICRPVLATFRRYKGGKPYRPIRYYTYEIVDNVLDLLAANIKKGDDGQA